MAISAIDRERAVSRRLRSELRSIGDAPMEMLADDGALLAGAGLGATIWADMKIGPIQLNYILGGLSVLSSLSGMADDSILLTGATNAAKGSALAQFSLDLNRRFK